MYLQGETPYNLDMGGAKTILGQMFGTQRLNAKEDGEVMLGYDLYSSALANILTEPSLSMPITVGLYAKWGSGTKYLISHNMFEFFYKESSYIEFEFSPATYIENQHLH